MNVPNKGRRELVLAGLGGLAAQFGADQSS
mgnify:CR=1 FL=1